MLRRFDMEGDTSRASLGIPLCPPIGVVDHEVTVSRYLNVSQQAGHQGQTEREVGHEVVVHDVEMDPLGCTPEASDFVREVSQVGIQDARRNLHAHG